MMPRGMNKVPLQELFNFGCELAAVAAEVAMAHYGAPAAYRKANGSEVTEGDVAVEQALTRRIHERFSDHAVVGEETADAARAEPDPARARYCWVIDPVDGTRNFIRRFPAFATSIAVMDGGRPVVGLVRWHHTGQLFAASAEGPALLDGRPVRVSDRPPDSNMLVGAQLGANHATQQVVTPWLSRWAVRNLGATALHLALVSCGGLDAAYAQDCRVWDLAAGALLIERAGGRCTGLKGEALLPVDPATCAGANYPFVAGGPKAHEALLTLLASPGR